MLIHNINKDLFLPISRLYNHNKQHYFKFIWLVFFNLILMKACWETLLVPDDISLLPRPTLLPKAESISSSAGSIVSKRKELRFYKTTVCSLLNVP